MLDQFSFQCNLGFNDKGKKKKVCLINIWQKYYVKCIFVFVLFCLFVCLFFFMENHVKCGNSFFYSVFGPLFFFFFFFLMLCNPIFPIFFPWTTKTKAQNVAKWFHILNVCKYVRQIFGFFFFFLGLIFFSCSSLKLNTEYHKHSSIIRN